MKRFSIGTEGPLFVRVSDGEMMEGWTHGQEKKSGKYVSK